jgi:hypothetical protein
MSGFFDAIMSLQTPFNMVVLIVLIGTVGGVISASVKEVRKYLCHREETQLKREMLDRGMKAMEIEQVLCASPTETKKPPRAMHTSPDAAYKG